MKKAAIIFCLAGLVIACNSGDSTDNKVENKEAEPTVAGEDPEVAKGLELVGKSDCFTCHKVVDASTGPAYEAVAAKYPDNDAVIDSLAKKIITGGVGNWGTVPMTPHPDLSEADAKAMTKYVLSLK
jgi:cytochrome c